MDLKSSYNAIICQAKFVVYPVTISGNSLVSSLMRTNSKNIRSFPSRYRDSRRESILNTACEMAIFEINSFVKNSFSQIIVHPDMLFVQEIVLKKYKPKTKEDGYAKGTRTLYVYEPEYTNLLDIVSYLVIVGINHILQDIRSPLKNNAGKMFNEMTSFLIHRFPKYNMLMKRSFQRVIEKENCQTSKDIKQFQYLHEIGALECFLSSLCFIAKKCDEAPEKISKLMEVIQSYEKSRDRLFETYDEMFYRFPSPARLADHPEYEDDVKKTRYYERIMDAMNNGKKRVYVFSDGTKQVVNFTERVTDCFRKKCKITKYKRRLGFKKWMFIALLDFESEDNSHPNVTGCISISPRSDTKSNHKKQEGKPDVVPDIEGKRHERTIKWIKIGVGVAIFFGIIRLLTH